VRDSDPNHSYYLNDSARRTYLLSCRTNDISIDQLLKLLRSQSWLELKRLPDTSLSDGESSEVVGRHCRGLHAGGLSISEGCEYGGIFGVVSFGSVDYCAD
jgi:hypothetical protein